LGLSGLRAFGSRSSFLIGGQERSPKTQPFHIVKLCGQLMFAKMLDKIFIKNTVNGDK
jgi:hypothetical protein